MPEWFAISTTIATTGIFAIDRSFMIDTTRIIRTTSCIETAIRIGIIMDSTADSRMRFTPYSTSRSISIIPWFTGATATTGTTIIIRDGMELTTTVTTNCDSHFHTSVFTFRLTLSGTC